MTTDRTNTPARRSPRLAWILAGASLVIVILVAVIVFAPRDATETGATGSGTASSTTIPTPTQNIAEQLIVPGYDPNRGTFTLPDASGLTAKPITANFALADDATTWGGTFGLSFEATELANPAWNSDNSNLTTTLAALGHPALRFGGNKVDRRMWWTSTDEPAPEWAEATVTPDDLERVAAVVVAVDADVTLVVDLGHNDPERAADMVKYATAAFGERLLAITIGNEPNGYSPEAQPDLAVRGDDWDTDAYQDALVEYSDAIDAETPGTNYAGPGAYDTTWLRAYTESDLPNKAAVTMHWYPLWRCDATSNQSSTTTIENLTSPSLRESAHKILGLGKGVADDAGLPFWVEETGPTSCSGGNETSRTHAQALWTSDYVFTAAEIGAERIAFHSMLGACDGGAPMSPVCASGSVDEPGEVIEGRSNFLALMLLSWVPDGQVLTPTVSGDGSVMVHAVYGNDGSLTYVIVDMRDPGATDALAPVSLHAPDGLGGGCASRVDAQLRLPARERRARLDREHAARDDARASRACGRDLDRGCSAHRREHARHHDGAHVRRRRGARQRRRPDGERFGFGDAVKAGCADASCACVPPRASGHLGHTVSPTSHFPHENWDIGDTLHRPRRPTHPRHPSTGPDRRRRPQLRWRHGHEEQAAQHL